MDCPSKDVLARMPLAEAVLTLWRWTTSEDRLNRLWDLHRGRCYEKVISFRVMVQLIADALLQHAGSGRRSFEKNIESGDLEASVQCAYEKLGRLPLPLSQAFLGECTAALSAAFPDWAIWQPPKSLRGFQIVVFDGKAIKRVAKRLKPLRGVTGGLLGGRVLVALEWSTGLAVAMHADADGEANDVRFVEDLVPVVRQRVPGPRLWLVDRGFCDLDQPKRFTAEDNDHFLIRYHRKVKFTPDPKKATRKGRDEEGQQYVEAWGWLGTEKDKRRRYVRMIQLKLPGKKKDADVWLVTDLLDADLYPAGDLLWLYRERWGIEQMFQQVTEVFGLRGLIGGTPQACIFQFAFCLLLYNMIQVVRAFIAEARNREPDEISTEKLFDDVEQQLIAWNILFDRQVTVEYFQPSLSLSELTKRLTRLLGSSWSDTWIKSPKQKRKAALQKQKARTHNSVYRLLQTSSRKAVKDTSKPR
jgi:hypothetical protein